MRISEFPLQFGDLPVLDLRGEVQIPRPLRLLLLELGRFQLLVDDAGGVDRGLLVLPLRLEFARLLFEVREIAFQFLQPVARGLVFLLFQCGLLDLQLHDLPFELVHLGRHRIQFHSQARGRLIHQINRFVG